MGAEYLRTKIGNCALSFFVAGFVCVAASVLVLLVGRGHATPAPFIRRPEASSPIVKPRAHLTPLLA